MDDAKKYKVAEESSGSNAAIDSFDPLKALQEIEKEEFEASKKRTLSSGEELAQKLYYLTNVEREKDLKVYIEAINSAVIDKPSEEHISILQTASDYFLKVYGKQIAKRGERPEIVDQIVRRTGKDTHKTVEALMEGFNAKALAREVWESHLFDDLDRYHQVRRTIFKLSNRQVAELRRVYSSIPAHEIAELIYESLDLTAYDGDPFPDISMIRYCLIGRTKDEVKQIATAFDDLFSDKEEDDEISPFYFMLKERLDSEQFSALLPLLEGFDADSEATKIHKLLRKCPEASQDIFESNLIHPDFSGNFRSNHADKPVWFRELKAHEQIERVVEYYTPQQFKEVNGQLKDLYKETLTPFLYRCNHPFDPRKVALRLFKALNNLDPLPELSSLEKYLSKEEVIEVRENHIPEDEDELEDEIEQAIADCGMDRIAVLTEEKIFKGLLPLNYLCTQEVFEVAQHFQWSTGFDLLEYVQEKVKEICPFDVPDKVETFLNIFLGGKARLPLKADLFSLFASKDQRTKNNLEVELNKARGEEAKYLKALIHCSKSPQEKTDQLISFFNERRCNQLRGLERAYWEQSKQQTLLRALENYLPEEMLVEINELLAGLDLERVADQINDNPEKIFSLINSSTETISRIRESYAIKYKTDLLRVVRSKFNTNKQIKKKTLASAILFGSRAKILHELLSKEETLGGQDHEMLLKLFGLKPIDVSAFEFSYNRHFTRFGYCLERKHGGLLERLRILASKGILSRETFVRIVPLLEGVDPEVAFKLHGLLIQDALSAQTISEIENILRTRRELIGFIQKIYNALDCEHTLREAIYELDLSLTQRNFLILLLDGFDPDAVIAELQEVQERLEGSTLGEEVNEILADPRCGNKNLRIPNSQNWAPEMFHQIRIRYFESFKVELITNLIKKGVPFKGVGVNSVALKIYGEGCKVAFELHDIIAKAKGKASVKECDQIFYLLEEAIPALRERIINLYGAYFGYKNGDNKFLGDLNGIMKDPKQQEQIKKLYREALDWDTPQASKENDESGEGLVLEALDYDEE